MGRGVSAPRGFPVRGSGYPPVNRMTHASENITFPCGGNYIGLKSVCHNLQVDCLWYIMKICTIFVSGADNCRILADGTKYTGTINRTQTGKTCQRWDQQSPHR